LTRAAVGVKYFFMYHFIAFGEGFVPFGGRHGNIGDEQKQKQDCWENVKALCNVCSFLHFYHLSFFSLY
jgi:hypothetical protein